MQHEYETAQNQPVNEDFFEKKPNVNNIQKNNINPSKVILTKVQKESFTFEPELESSFADKLDQQFNKLNNKETDNELNVIENFYTDYQCPPPGKLTRLRQWKTSFGTKAGIAIATGIQLAPIVKNGIVAAWPGVKTSLIQKSQSFFQGTKHVAKLSARPVAIVVAVAAVMGLGYLGFNYLVDTVFPAIQEAMKSAPVKPAPVSTDGVGKIATGIQGSLRGMTDLISSLAYLVGIGMSVKAALKFKEYGECPERVSISQPLTLMMVAAMLIALPNFLSMTTDTVFGTNAQATVQISGDSAQTTTVELKK